MNPLALSNQLCFRAYALSRHITAMYQPLLKKLELTYPQYLAMLVLWESDGVSVKQMGEQLMLDSGTLTPLLKRMEEAGLLQRKRSAEDERVVHISLTDKGKKLKSKAAAIPGELQKCMGFSAEDYLEFMQVSARLLKHKNV
ncbi:MAG: MarR family transcriptional regulator [Bacteroidia bacterium]|nr:MarR family transcriptional regulator [Bacteroidia bacterium]